MRRPTRVSAVCFALTVSLMPVSPVSAAPDGPALDMAGFAAVSEDGQTTSAILGTDDPSTVDEIEALTGEAPVEVSDGMYAVDLDVAHLGELAALPGVDYVEPDYTFTIAATSLDEGTAVTDRIGADGFHGGFSTTSVTGVDLDVDIAVLDTGVNDHSDLEVVAAYDCLAGTCVTAADPVDVHGHGTMVAGNAAAFDDGADTGGQAMVGTAPGARIWSLQVLSDTGSGPTSAIVAALDWLVDADGIEVANMSFGCMCYSWSMAQAMARAEAAGVVLVAAAGNDNSQVGDGWYTPGGSNHAITVAAMADTDGEPGGDGPYVCGYDDSLASFTNWGTGIDVAAPGVCLLSTHKGGGYVQWSGTSAASPVVAGAAASLIAGGGFPASPDRRTTVLAALTDVYSVAADSECGYGDYYGVRPRPPLVMMSGCGMIGVPPPVATPTTNPLGFRVSYAQTPEPVASYVVQLDHGGGWVDTAGGNTTGAAGSFQVAAGELDVYEVRMKASDAGGSTSYSQPVAVTVPDVTAPVVTLDTASVGGDSPDVIVSVDVDDETATATTIHRRATGTSLWSTLRVTSTDGGFADPTPTRDDQCATWEYRATAVDAYDNTSSVTDTVTVCVHTPVATPTDSVGHVFEADVTWLIDSGVSRGCSESGDFCPDDQVTRGQMAAFLHRAYPELAPVREAPDFDDTAGSVFAADIAWLYRTGITRGCSDRDFCPDAPVTRGQMAAFLHRALGDVTATAGSAADFDDTASSPFAADIEWIAGQGITRGCSPGRYCPDTIVTRGQMAAFLHRADDLLGG
jgi:hypothetical protein